MTQTPTGFEGDGAQARIAFEEMDRTDKRETMVLLSIAGATTDAVKKRTGSRGVLLRRQLRTGVTASRACAACRCASTISLYAT
jgi:hypothetical protein